MKKPSPAPSPLAAKCSCGGVLFDVSPKLAIALAVKVVKCDACGAKFASYIPPIPVPAEVA